MQLLKDSQDLYGFVTNHEEDYNDFIELLDDDSNITSDTLGIMNQISAYFKSFKERLTHSMDSFGQMIGYFSKEMLTQSQNDENFLTKLDVCNQNMPAIRELVTRTTEKSENTINTIERCLKSGEILWMKANGNYDFKIKVNIDDGTQQQMSQSSTRKHQVKIFTQD